MRTEHEDEEPERRQEEKPRKTWRRIVKAGVVTLGVLAAYDTPYTVHQSQHAVVTRLGNPVRVVFNPIERKDNQDEIAKIKESYKAEGMPFAEGPGLYFKLPFIESVTKYHRGLLRWNGYPEEIATKDKKYLWVDVTARPFVQDPLKFKRRVGTEESMYARLDDNVDSVTRDSITQRDLIEIVRSSNRKMDVIEKELADTTNVGQISQGRPLIVEEITNKSRKALSEYGIGLPSNDGVMLRTIVYVDQVKSSVEQRMMAERNRIASKYRSEGEGEYQNIVGTTDREVKRILSQAYKTAKEIEGDADAKATKIYADAYSKDQEFFRFWRTLNMYETSFKDGNTKLVLKADSELSRMLKGDTYKK